MATATPFRRARSEAQREQRRAAILATAAAMLADGVLIGDLSLNELARRVGLAKSNVLRYFESREAVLLTLLDREYGAWLDAVAARFADGAPPGAGGTTSGDGGTASGGRRSASGGGRSGGGGGPTSAGGVPIGVVEHVADVLSRAVVERPMLSELVAHAQLVLEQNVSAEVAADYKRRAVAQAMRLVHLVEAQVGELPDPSRIALAGGVNVAIGGVWGQCRPSPGMTAAYERYPELAGFKLDQRIALRELLATVLVGLLIRPARAE